MAIKHTFVSAKPEGVDPTKVRASNWNDDHEIEPGTITSADLGGDITAAGQTLITAANAAAQRAALGLATIATTGSGADLTNATVTTAKLGGDITAAGKDLLDDANAAAQRTTLGLVAVASSGSAADLSTGTLPAARMPALTGDVTSTVGTVATTIAAAAVTLAKMAALATGRFIGRITGGSGDPESLTGTQATTLLDVFTASLKGLVPSPGGSSTGRVLKDDATWGFVDIAAAALLGDGSDGSPTFDGSTTILGMVPSSNVYTLTRDFYFEAPVINNGVTIKEAGFVFLARGNVTLNGVIERNGNNAVNSSSGLVGAAGAALTGGRLPGSAGGASGVNANVAGQAAGGQTGTPQGYNTAGGAGGAGQGGAGGAGGTNTEAIAVSNGWRQAHCALQGRTMIYSAFSIGGGGGSGGGNSGSPSGSGGGSGGWCSVAAKSFSGTGSIQAKGGNGGNAFAGGGNAGGGGGGKGGIIAVVWVTGAQPTCTVTGGTGGTGVGTGVGGSAGTDGLVIPFKLGV